MRTLFWLLLAGVAFSAGCAPIEAASHAGLPGGVTLQSEQRGIVGEPCPPAQAAKGHC
ncbi:MAG: hypothetical protein ABWY05_01955 [Noviherbaspirillum sp.]